MVEFSPDGLAVLLDVRSGIGGSCMWRSVGWMLLIKQSGYPFIMRASFTCVLSLSLSPTSLTIVNTLCIRVLMTPLLCSSGWLLWKCRYWSVWVSLRKTLVEWLNHQKAFMIMFDFRTFFPTVFMWIHHNISNGLRVYMASLTPCLSSMCGHDMNIPPCNTFVDV